MELFEAMRTTFSAREYTGDPLPDDVLFEILDNARFAPSGGNRQGVHITIVRDQMAKKSLSDLAIPAAKRYIAQSNLGESPWNSVLAARQAGFGGTITTLAVSQEDKIQALLGIPKDHAVCAIMPLGKPVKQLTKLSRNPVDAFVTLERFYGAPFTKP